MERVESDGRTVTLTWAAPVQFYRALSLIPQPLAACSVHEKARFETCGVMFDCSRNAVLKPEGLRYILRKMALMGLNMGMMYTEDTYEVPEQPFFGYKRGRYSYDELKALDDYADLFGIELCPCIQTLGHLKRILHWPAFHSYRDNDEVLLADDENTYVLLDQMIRAAPSASIWVWTRLSASVSAHIWYSMATRIRTALSVVTSSACWRSRISTVCPP